MKHLEIYTEYVYHIVVEKHKSTSRFDGPPLFACFRPIQNSWIERNYRFLT